MKYEKLDTTDISVSKICYGLAFSGKHVEISCSVSA